jgi:hypothetical protein
MQRVDLVAHRERELELLRDRAASDGATAIAPIELMGWLSKIGRQFAPPSVVFHTPPATAPK